MVVFGVVDTVEEKIMGYGRVGSGCVCVGGCVGVREVMVVFGVVSMCID